MSRGNKTVFVVTLTAIMVMVIALAVFAAASDTANGQEKKRPLAREFDMTVYDPPEWSRYRISDVWKLEDRLKNRSYWLLKIDGQWVTLNLGEVENLG